MLAGIDDDRALLLHVGDRGLREPIGRRAVAEQPVADDADARALQAVRVEDARVVAARRGAPAVRRSPDRPDRRRAIAPSSAAASATVRAIGPAVSWLCEIGTIPLRLTRPSVGLMPTSAVVVRRRHDRAVGFGADAAAARLAATAAPEPELEPDGLRSSAYGFLVWPPRPLQPLVECVERKFAHSLRLVLPRITAPASRSRCDDEGILRRLGAGQRQRSGGGHHAIGGGDVVLDAGSGCRAADRAHPALALGVELVGDAERVGIDLDDAAQRRALPVDRLDAGEVLVDERARGLLARDCMRCCSSAMVASSRSNGLSAPAPAPKEPSPGRRPATAARTSRVIGKSYVVCRDRLR